MNGMRIRFETKPGKSFASAGVLPSSFASSTTVRAVSSEVSGVRTTSTSAITGTGLKKCMPITLVGPAGDRGQRGDRDGRRVRREDRVRRERLVGAAEDVLLRVGILGGRLDHQVGGRRGRPPASTRASTSAGSSSAPFSARRVEALLHRREAALDRARERVVERNAAARRGEGLRDAAAHLAGADDENVLAVHGAIVVQSARVTA